MKYGKYLIISILAVGALVGATWVWCYLAYELVCDVCHPRNTLHMAKLNRDVLEQDWSDFGIRYVMHNDVWQDVFGCYECVDDDEVSHAIEDVKIKKEIPVLRLNGYILGVDADLNNAVLFITETSSGESVYVHVGDWINDRYGVESVQWSDFGRYEGHVPLLEVIVYDCVNDERFKIYEN